MPWLSESPFPLIRVSGGPRERGIAHGEAASDRIARSLTFYAETVAPSVGVAWGRLCDGLAERMEEWRALDPEGIEEIEGIAQGAGQSALEILGLNARGSFVRTARHDNVAVPVEGCTSFVVLPQASADGHLYVGQTVDNPAETEDTMVLTHHMPDKGPRWLTLDEAGQLGRRGANTAGIALHGNGLTGPRDPAALPALLWRRRMLRQANFTDAVAVVLSRPRATTTNVLVSHRDGVAIDLETTPSRVRWLFPRDGWLVHTNHFEAEVPQEISATYTPTADSLVRYARVLELMRAAADRKVTFLDLVGVTRDHFADGKGVCFHASEAGSQHDRWATVAAVITDLTDGVMHVAAGPPCSNGYCRIEIETGSILRDASSVGEAAPAA